MRVDWRLLWRAEGPREFGTSSRRQRRGGHETSRAGRVGQVRPIIFVCRGAPLRQILWRLVPEAESSGGGGLAWLAGLLGNNRLAAQN